MATERIQIRGAGGGTASTGGVYTHGAAFTATADGTITHLAAYHYAPSGHTAGQIHPLSLWSNAGVKLAGVDFVCPGNGLFRDADKPTPRDAIAEPRSTAWYELPLATPYPIVAGQTYRVSAAMNTYTYFTVAAPASLAPHLTVYHSGFYLAGVDVFPTTEQPANYYPVDVVAEFVTGPAPSVTITGATYLDVLTIASATITAASQVDSDAVSATLLPLPPRLGAQRLAGGAVIEIRTVAGAIDTWVDIACEVVSARTIWGAVKSAGYLTQAEGGFLELEIYDPDRLLDPANTSSPYYAVLKPGLWIRFWYENAGTRTLIKWARVDSIAHTITTAMGRISAHDWVSVLSNNPFPNDARSQDTALLGSTLHTFAAGILGAAWQPIPPATPFPMPVTVEQEATPIAIKPQTQGSPGPDVWSQITDHALATFTYAWIDPGNVMRFAPLSYASGGQILLGISGPMPLEFISQSDAAGVYNSIWVRSSASPNGQIWAFDENSELTWGVKRFTSPPIPDKPPGLYTPQQWAEKFLPDRATPSMDALPLRIWPTSPSELRSLIAVQGMNSVVMTFDSVTPNIKLVARAIGARIGVDSDGWSVELFTWLLK